MSDELLNVKEPDVLKNGKTLIFNINPCAVDDGNALGSVQSVINSRKLFMVVGAVCVILAVYGLFVTLFSGTVSGASTIFIGIVSLTGVIVLGARMMYNSTCKVTLRQKGLEIKSVRESYSFEYKDLEISLEEKLEHKNKSMGGSSSRKKRVGNYRYIWVCTIFVNGKDFPIILRDTQYAELDTKVQQLIDNLVEV